MYILSHRGLNPAKNNFYTESTLESFEYYLKKSFGIEFDVNFTKDKKIIIFHDEGLERITGGKDKRLFSELSFKDAKKIRIHGCKIAGFDELMNKISKYKSPLNALHLKGRFQTKKYLDILLKYLRKHKYNIRNLLIFDVRPETAEYLKKNSANLILSPSVAHEFDVKRYNHNVNNTLVTVSAAIKNKKNYDWVWMDEWDRTDNGKKEKKFYNRNNFEKLRTAGYKIGLVSPELHGTSPGLLGLEIHQDSLSLSRLKDRIKEILLLRPDLICTDYPELVESLKYVKP